MMTMLQRYILIVSLSGAALIAHLTFCGWGFGYQTHFSTKVLIGWSGSTIKSTGRGASTKPVYGCYAKASHPLSVFGGLLAPWGLLTASMIMCAGLPRASRRHRGCCLQCGYDLRGESVKGCPECGWNRNKSNLKETAGHGEKG